MRSRCFWILVVFHLVTVYGCHRAENDHTKSVKLRTRITAKNLNQIAEIQWILQSMTIDGKKHEIVGDKPFVKLDREGRISGFASVNRFFGTAEIDETGQVTWTSPLGATRMAGPVNLMKQEDAFLEVLTKIEHMSTEGKYLCMCMSNHKTELVFINP